MSTQSFKVIIGGGGLTGLVAAHALRAAGIDYIILEQRSDILVDEGGLIALAPEVLRICHQLGLWEKMQEIGFEYFVRSAYEMNGDHQDSESFKYIRNKYVHCLLNLETDARRMLNTNRYPVPELQSGDSIVLS